MPYRLATPEYMIDEDIRYIDTVLLILRKQSQKLGDTRIYDR